MALARGTQLGSCEILELLETGGTGEVYRAHDARLRRDVAVQALPDGFAHDVDRTARFEREIQVLAALNHSNLATVHELRELNGSKYLILELVEGETLANRIARGQLPVNDALDIAVQIARALEAGHEKGIVHRDLRPATIKLTPDGRVKVLDFGLANAIDVPAACISPEQARGKEVDRRADIWAFGCMLFEMLAGRPAFQKGETLSDTLAGILAREPDWQALPSGTPVKVRALIERCLRKDDRRRLRDIGDARIAIEEARSDSQPAPHAGALPAHSSRRREIALAAFALFFLVTAAGVVVRLVFPPVAASPTVRFDVARPQVAGAGLYLSPDGKKVAFITQDNPLRIWVRPIDSAIAEPIPSTEGMTGVLALAGTILFWSADSQYIAFFADGRLKKVSATGGPAQIICELPPSETYNYGTWGAGDVILLGAESGPLLRVPAAGGRAEPATELNTSDKEVSHRYPHFLPDGRHYLYIAFGSSLREGTAYIASLDSKERRRLEGIAAAVRYASGHLVFIRDGALSARPFDPDRLEFNGAAFTIVDRWVARDTLTYPFSVSMNGILSIPNGEGPGRSDLVTELVWSDRKSGRFETAGPEGEYRRPELSPDGKFVAFERGSPRDIWILDLERGISSQLTTDPAADSNPRWSPNGKTIAFSSARKGKSGLYTRAVGVVGEDKLVFQDETQKTLSDWTRDGKYLVYSAVGSAGAHIWALPISDGAGDIKPIPIVQTTASREIHPRVSPDGQWVAYTSNRSGQDEVLVQSFPKPGPLQQVSKSGVSVNDPPRWSPDGKELFYFSLPPNAFWSVPISTTGGSLATRTPARVFQGFAGINTSMLNPAPDGRFLLQRSPTGAAAPPAAFTNGVTMIVNWAGNRER